MPAWLLLVFLPKYRVTQWVAHSYLYPVLLGAFYLFMFVISFGGDGGMGSLADLKVSFQRDEVLILGWVHYLVFDLFIGSWISRDAQKHAFPHLVIVPVLILTLFAGPIGLLLYLLFRAARLKKVTF